MMLRLILADDHKIVLDGLQSMLAPELNIAIIACVQNGHQVLHAFETQVPDLLIMDLQMPGMDGIETAIHIKKTYPEVKILALSMHNEPHLIRKFIKAGADGYILKDAGKAILMEAIETISQGHRYFDQAVMHKVMDHFSPSHSAKSGKQLSKRELEIVRLIGEQLTTAEIAEKLHLSPLTIETHRKNILLKLGLRNSVGLIRYAVENGLLN